MYKNKALIDRIMDTHSVNENDAIIYRKFTSLIEEYNRIAIDKGLPTKKVPIYNKYMNYSLMVKSVASILKDIDRISYVDEEEKEEKKVLRDVTFDGDTFNDSIWTYTKDGNNVNVKLNPNDEFSELITEGAVILGYDEMPYERLIDTEGNEYTITSYYDMFSDLPNTVISLNIDGWTNGNIENMSGMFGVRSSLRTLTLGTNFNTSSVTDMASMFYECSSLTTLTLGTNFNTSKVTNMGSMFGACSSLTTLTLGDKFNTSNVTNMGSMFGACWALESLDLGDNFDTSNVTDMNTMFVGCSKLTSLTLGDNFDTSKVEDMNNMFSGCSAFTSLSLGDNFDTSSVENMNSMFSGCSALESLTLGNNFNTSSVENMAFMFYSCSALTALSLGNNFDTSSVQSMNSMFSGCSKLASLELGSNFNTSNVENMGSMFTACPLLTSLTLYKSAKDIVKELPDGTWKINESNDTVNIEQGTSATWSSAEPSDWETVPLTLTLIPEKIRRNVTFSDDIYEEDNWKYTKYSRNNVKVANYNASPEDTVVFNYNQMPYEKLIDDNGIGYPINSYSNMFISALWSDTSSITIDNWTNYNVTDMSYMFGSRSVLQSLELGTNFNTSSVMNMSYMFYSCSALQSLELGTNFNTSSVTTMSYMFGRCSALTSLTLGDKFDTSKVMNMSYMFYSCSALTSLTLGNKFIISSETNMGSMFQGCSKLESISLYKSAKDIIKELPDGTWKINESNDTVTVTQGASAVWSSPDILNNWTNEQYTLSRTIQQT